MQTQRRSGTPFHNGRWPLKQFGVNIMKNGNHKILKKHVKVY